MQEDQDQGSETAPFCPSFNSYSSNRHLVNIASRVAQEEQRSGLQQQEAARNDDVDDEEFEFVLVRANPGAADEAGDAGDGVSFPVFPVFNRDLLLEYEEERRGSRDFEKAGGIPLRKLFIAGDEDRDFPASSSSSSSEADELEGVPPGTYCVWTPKQSPMASPSLSPGRCKKSNSTGSSTSKHDDHRRNRWRLRDLLLRRSSSDGKESYVFFLNGGQNGNNSSSGEGNLAKKKDDRKGKKTGKKKAEKEEAKEKEKAKVSAKASEVIYVKRSNKKAVKEGDYYYNNNNYYYNNNNRKSYLPYRQDLVHGFFFANMNSLNKAFHPF